MKHDNLHQDTDAASLAAMNRAKPKTKKRRVGRPPGVPEGRAVAHSLRQAREFRRWSITDLAQELTRMRLPTTSTMLYRYEYGISVDDKRLAAIAELLQCPVSDLIARPMSRK